jgi:hypothetical protein
VFIVRGIQTNSTHRLSLFGDLDIWSAAGYASLLLTYFFLRVILHDFFFVFNCQTAVCTCTQTSQRFLTFGLRLFFCALSVVCLVECYMTLYITVFVPGSCRVY